MNKTISVETLVNKPIDDVWNFWTSAPHIEKWHHASDDWECTHAVNDVRVGGRFSNTLAAKDKSTSFDFTGVYTDVKENAYLAYTLDDARTVTVSFVQAGEAIHVVETFEMERENSEEMQKMGWQAVLDNFKLYAESQ